MSVDFTSQESMDAYAAEVERALARPDRVPGDLWGLIAVWIVNGAIFTIGAATSAKWLYGVGLVVALFWVVGFWLAKNPARWWTQ